MTFVTIPGPSPCAISTAGTPANSQQVGHLDFRNSEDELAAGVSYGSSVSPISGISDGIELTPKWKPSSRSESL
jgi:hypothetical protein